LAKLTRDLEVYSRDKKMIQHSKILKGPEHRSEKKKHPLYVLIKLVSVSTKNGFAAQEEITLLCIIDIIGSPGTVISRKYGDCNRMITSSFYPSLHFRRTRKSLFSSQVAPGDLKVSMKMPDLIETLDRLKKQKESILNGFDSPSLWLTSSPSESSSEFIFLKSLLFSFSSFGGLLSRCPRLSALTRRSIAVNAWSASFKLA